MGDLQPGEALNDYCDATNEVRDKARNADEACTRNWDEECFKAMEDYEQRNSERFQDTARDAEKFHDEHGVGLLDLLF